MPTALVVRQVEGKPGSVYYPLTRKSTPSQQPKDNEVLIRFIRQHLYPGISFGGPQLADGCGVVVSSGNSAAAKKWLNKRVVVNPGTGWKDDPEGPEDPTGYKIMGGTKFNPLGTAVDEMIIDAGEVEEAPKHLDSMQAAALPLAGLTAWRATLVKSGNAKPGHNILETAIGGGVAIMCLLFAVKAGANVYVSSGSEEKISKAKEMGAKGGVNYKEKDWDKKLVGMLPEDRKYLDAIVDGAGGDVVQQGAKLLKSGGVISIYGMTTGPKMPFLMTAVLKNIEVRGSTMGSRKEFADMVKFVQEKELVPIVSKVAHGGLDNLEGIDVLFEEMKKGTQFGKLVIEIAKEQEASKL